MQAILGAAIVLLSASPSLASKHHHLPHLERNLGHLHVRHTEEVSASAPVIKKRGGQCEFPTDDPNLVAITPNESNAGWAMSPDQACEPGHYCPFACKPGMVMAQWDPDSDYSYPASMNGGLYCNDNGEIEKPFEDSPNCVDGSGAVEAINKCSSHMSWCQTVLPGNEAMLIPTLVSSKATLAVPDSSYWCSTAAHFYINPPGTGEEGCIWGSDSEPIGNWSPYVAGANTESDGTTFVKLGWNPIWEDSGLKSKLPDFGIEILCPDGGCNGLPCKIDPSDGEGAVQSNESADGAGGAAFCVVTVSKGTTAQIVAFEAGSGGGGAQYAAESDDSPISEEVTPEVTPEPTPEPTTSTPEPTTSEEPETTTEEPTTTSTTSTSTSSTPTPTPTTSSTSTTPTSTSTTPSSTTTSSKTSTSKKASTTSTHKYKGGIFQENGTSTSTVFHHMTTDEPAGTTALTEAAPTTSSKGEAGRQQGSAAVAGLVVAFIAAACFF
ncbi:Fc.00g089740.m01.CDS01 [Cosmosporella sp. VM-42]